MAEQALKQVEPSLYASLPVTRLTRVTTRCVIGEGDVCPLSTDGKYLVYFQFGQAHVTSRQGSSLKGAVMVAEASGLGARELARVRAESPLSGSLQQWAGDTHRVVYGERPRWRDARDADATCEAYKWYVADVDSGERWEGGGIVRGVSPDGNSLCLVPSEDVHHRAEEAGRTLEPEDVTVTVLEYETGSIVRLFSIEDVLACHPHSDAVRLLRLGVKTAHFSPDGSQLMLCISNAWYARVHREERLPMRREVVLADLSSGEMRYVGPYGRSAVWHPGGQAILTRQRDSQGRPRLACYNTRTGVMGFVGEKKWNAEAPPAVQPMHQKYLAVGRWESQDARASLRLYDADTMARNVVLMARCADHSNESGTRLHPAWGPDGNSIYVNCAHLGHAQVYRVDVGASLS